MQRAFSVWPLLLVLLGGAALAVCQWLIFFYAPVEAQLGLMQKVEEFLLIIHEIGAA